ncbi:MAG: Gfo/Idh/MocA family oxidoreductase [Erysipelotrichaceae bacterium]|nr:Gfo/Idh/MocA family oxidoreductase [Erysipelotrichaceae bacterium]
MKIGIVGTGSISSLFVKSANKIKDFNCLSIYGRSEDKTIAFKEEFCLAKHFTDYDEFLSDEEMNCVYIGLPNSLHYEYAVKAAKKNKHIIIEKPFVSNLREFDSLIEICKQNDVKIVEVNRVLPLPNYDVVKENVTKCGNISIVSGTYFQYSRKYDALVNGETPNVFTSEYSGGALMDLGVYSVHLIVGLFGLPVASHYSAKKKEDSVDLAGVLTLEYKDFIVVLMQSKVSFGNNQFMIQGDKASIVAAAIPSRLEKIDLQTKNEKVDISVLQHQDNFYYALSDIQKCFLEKAHYENRLKQSRNVLSVLDEARRSAGIIFSADKQ